MENKLQTNTHRLSLYWDDQLILGSSWDRARPESSEELVKLLEDIIAKAPGLPDPGMFRNKEFKNGGYSFGEL